MPTEQETEKVVRAALERDPRINLHRSPLEIGVRAGEVVLTGEVADIQEKRIAVERARTVAPPARVIDRLRVRPTTLLGDGAVRDAVCRHLTEEAVFLRMRIDCRVAGDAEAVTRAPDNPDGTVEASVREGIVTLRGRVWSRSHKRLAAVLCWWAAGCRDVIDELDVEPGERDSDAEIRDAIELVLNKDPIVHSDQVTAEVREGNVTLRGLVATREEKWMIERDVWYIEGVRDVINEIEVYQGPTGREPLPASPPGFE